MSQKGWECPRCGTINAPFMPVCGGINCKPQTVTIATDRATDPNNKIHLHTNCTCPVCLPGKYKINQ